ncbi:MAG: 3'-5' exonuclease [Anaerolineae bacterium]
MQNQTQVASQDLDYNSVVVVDVEATCWKQQPPPGEQHEIIEIGVCLFNLDTREASDKRSILVKPARSTVSAFCTELTSLTQELVDTGISFAEACTLLETDYHTQTRLWVSWGEYDLKMFETQCASFGVLYPFGSRYVNLKWLFARKINKKQMGLQRALSWLQIAPEGTAHRGHDDAWNTAQILSYLLRAYGRDLLKDFM